MEPLTRNEAIHLECEIHPPPQTVKGGDDLSSLTKRGKGLMLHHLQRADFDDEKREKGLGFAKQGEGNRVQSVPHFTVLPSWYSTIPSSSEREQLM
jgi:hypothetical protein